MWLEEMFQAIINHPILSVILGIWILIIFTINIDIDHCSK